MALARNAEAFLTAMDAQKAQRWSLLWLEPALASLATDDDSPRVRVASAVEWEALLSELGGAAWAHASLALKQSFGLCETSVWALAPLKGVGICLIEEPQAGSAELCEPLLRLWEGALQACVLYQRSARPASSGAKRRLDRLRKDYRDLMEKMLLDVNKRRLAEDELIHAALHDSLTALPNRALLLDRLDLSLKRCQRDPSRGFAVLFLDLDRFKVVNDSLGHQAGDELLKGIAQRLLLGLRPGDTVARLGGDEFCILLDDLGALADALPVAERVLLSIAEPLRVGDNEIYPGASLGVALGGPQYSSPEALLRDADTAMYRAKHKGKGRLEVFDLHMHEEVAQRLQIEHGLRRAVEREELWVAYQPLVSLQSGEVIGFEALARWTHPLLGNVRPDIFIPVAEETGLIEGLGARVLEIACSQAQAWTGQSPDGGSPALSVNLSARQLRLPNLVSLVAEAMRRHQLGPGRLKLEVTESLLMEDPALCARVLGDLGSIGAEIWLDDFGSGYSSLGSLTQFPIHSIKLDRSFILGLENGERALGLLEGVMALARQMHLKVVAEGIETEAQAALLRRLGCPLAQGYLYSKPLPAAEAERYLRQSRLGAAPI